MLLYAMASLEMLPTHMAQMPMLSIRVLLWGKKTDFDFHVEWEACSSRARMGTSSAGRFKPTESFGVALPRQPQVELKVSKPVTG